MLAVGAGWGYPGCKPSRAITDKQCKW